MATDTELRIKGLQVLTEALGSVDAERFISLILKEPFDYTKWQRNLWPAIGTKKLSREAMDSFKAKQNRIG